MKTLRIIHKLFGVAVVAFACLLGWLVYVSARSGREASRMETVQSTLEAKLASYQQAKGEYPDSLQFLSLTNSPEEIQMLTDIQKINYRRTVSGYVLSYEGGDGYTSRRTLTNEKK